MKQRKENMVSISIICYNQKDYISQAIDSVLMQKVNFKYEIVLSDDCSTDGTDLICKKYAKKYPNVIRYIANKKNIGAVRNYIENYQRCNGKYVAYLEGDDFFIDPYKLQKQVDFLEKNLDYVICCSHVEKINSDGDFLGQLIGEMKDTYSVEELCKGDFIATPTCMVRNKLVKTIPEWIFEFKGCDWTFDILNAEHGKIKFMNERLSAYRVHSQGEWNKLSSKQQVSDVLNMVKKVNKYTDFKYNSSFSEYAEALEREFIIIKRRNKVYRILNYIKRNPLFFIKPKYYKTLLKKVFLKLYNSVHDTKFLSQQIYNLSNRLDYFENIYTKENTLDSDVLILDDAFPIKLSGFRYGEYSSYLNHFDSSIALTNGTIFPFFNISTSEIYNVVKNFNDENNTNKLKVFNDNIKINTKIAIITFLGNVYNYLPFLEKNEIPFIFTLYPGGSFALNDVISDKKLIRVLESKFFRKVIVTQKIIYNYLIDNKLCRKEQIEYIHGGVLLSNEKSFSLGEKKYFLEDKDTLDVCFVAQKYMDKGIDKGYDKFIAAAHILVKKYKNIRFHVVGGFDENEIDVSDIKNHIRFYGKKPFDWFREFYRDKDIIVSANTPFILGKGYFDGFPLTCVLDAMMNNVVGICSDELNENIYYEDGKDILIIKPTADSIVRQIDYLYNNPKKIKEIGMNGKKVTSVAYSYENQISKRIKILENEIEIANKRRKK